MKYLFLIFLLLVACNQAEELPDAPVVEEVKEEVKEEIPELSPREEFDFLFKADPTFQGNYNVKTVLSGEENNGKMTVYRKKGNFRQETDVDSFYVIDDEGYICYEENSLQCFHLPKNDNVEEPSLSDSANVVKLPNRKILTFDAVCFEITEANAKSVQCYSDDGILLYFLSESDNYSNLVEAGYISKSVSDKSFELPAEPQELPEEFQNAQPK